MAVFEADKWKTMDVEPIIKSLKVYVLRKETILKETDVKSADLEYFNINGKMKFNSHPCQKVQWFWV